MGWYMSGAAIDQGAPGTPAIGPDGKPIEMEAKFEFTFSSKAEARALAKAIAVQGHQQVADRISATIGDGKVEVKFVEKYPLVSGIIIGAAGVLTVYGGFRLGKYLRNRSTMKNAMATGKVVPIGPQKVQVR